MAIYHFSAKVISRANGSSAVASAAYRAAERLHDDRLGRDHDFSNKAGVVHSEIMLPEGAPERLNDRATLWNEVEAGEKRKDAQLAREVEFSIPRELNQQQGVQLAREFVEKQFVERGGTVIAIGGSATNFGRFLNVPMEDHLAENGAHLPDTKFYTPGSVLRAKVEIAIARGKKLHDKRETEKQRDWNREKSRLMKEKG